MSKLGAATVSLSLAILVLTTAQAQPREWVLPVAVNGIVRAPLHFQTIIRVVNLSNSASTFTLEGFDNDGKPAKLFNLFPISIGGTKSTFEIEAYGMVEVSTAGDDPSFNGWIRMVHDSGVSLVASAELALINAPVGPHPICHRPSTEIATSVVMESKLAASKFGTVAVNLSNRKTAYALVNPSTDRTTVLYLSLLDSAGKLVASSTVTLGPQTRASRFLHEFLPMAPADFKGVLRVTADGPAVVGGLAVLLPEGKFVGLVVETAPPIPCLAVLQPARNPLTGECRVFPTPCSVPEGWVFVSRCN